MMNFLNFVTMGAGMRAVIGMVLVCFLNTVPLWADTTLTQAIFVKVEGEVKVQTSNRIMTAQVDLAVNEGDQISTNETSSAELKLFDGSNLSIAPGTKFTLTALQKPSEDDKVIKFKMLWGSLTALVTKLTTAHSSFEIESGGVVCGVRGTKYTVNCSKGPNPQVEVIVHSGTVWTADSFGNNSVLHKGEHLSFVNGARMGNGPSGDNGSKKGNRSSTTGNAGSTAPTGANGVTGTTTDNSGASSDAASGTAGNNGPNSSGGAGSNSGTGSNTDNGSNSGTVANNGSGSNNAAGSNSGTGANNGAGTGSNSGMNGNSAAGANNPVPSSSTGAGTGSLGNSSLGMLNNQFQNNVLINGESNLNNPTVQQAIQLNVNLIVGP